MKKGNKYFIPIISVVAGITILFSQGDGYLSQKLMVENNIRDRVKDALSKLIESHKYVINVDVELEVLEEVNEQFTYYAPRAKSTNQKMLSPAEETANALKEIQEKMVRSDLESQEDKYSIGLPIPGFEVDVSNSKTNSSSIQTPKPISPKALKATYQESQEDEPAEKEVVDKVLSTKRPSKTVIKRMDLSLILQEGAAPELIENIRQLTMAAAKFDRQRGDKLTIMTASFKERRDQRTAEQVMLKNIAEKIDVMERKRSMEATDWRDDIRKYKEEVLLRREEDLASFQSQLAELDKLRLQEAADFEKRELARKDSIRNSKLENEIQALKDMLAVNVSKEESKDKKLDSTRFAMLDNEMQGLRKMLLQAMLQDSIEAQQMAQAKIAEELALREKEKASRDSVIADKIAALDAVQADLQALEAENSQGLDTKMLIIIGLGLLSVILLVLIVLQKGKKSSAQAPYPPGPMPPYPYPPPPRRRKRRRKKEPIKEEKEEPKKEEVKAEPKESNQVQEESNGPAPVSAAQIAAMEAQNESANDSVPQIVDDPNVLKSEIDDIRKSVVSMSVGQPARTSTIVKEWLEQPAPEAPASEDSSNDDSGGEEEESGEEKK
tara:strand:+ start:803 stop:2632 length:1830 start_codon:yes stop_codon:yes gene_type:complete